jgi:thiol-disulfide isomerase/thioredoxin
MSTSTRWTLAVLAVVAGLVVALAAQLSEHPGPPASQQPSTVPPGGEVGGGEELGALRRRAELAPCPHGRGPGPAGLRGITVGCAADGSAVDVASAVAGQTVLLNLWAYWCAPCRTELPAMADYQRRAGATVTVVTVHTDDNEAAGLQLLADLGVHLPTLQDGGRRIAAALRVPNVMPATVVVRGDGSVAATLPRAFANADEIAAAVDPRLGVPQ